MWKGGGMARPSVSFLTRLAKVFESACQLIVSFPEVVSPVKDLVKCECIVDTRTEIM